MTTKFNREAEAIFIAFGILMAIFAAGVLAVGVVIYSVIKFL